MIISFLPPRWAELPFLSPRLATEPPPTPARSKVTDWLDRPEDVNSVLGDQA